MKREKEQYKALEAWKNNNFKAIMLCATGFGKTKVGIIAACEHIRRENKERWLVLVPTTNLVSQWYQEAIKWGYEKEWLTGVTCMCYQSAYKLKNEVFDGLIADECHLSSSEEYRKVYLNNKFKKVLLLTATEPENEEYREFLYSIAPVVYKITLAEAVEKEIISPFNIYAIECPLTIGEKTKYDKAQNSFIYYKMKLGGYDAFERAQDILRNKDSYTSEDRTNAVMLYRAIRNRKNVVQNASSKLILAKKIVEMLPKDKIITFAETNKSTDALFKLLQPISLRYHSTMSKEERNFSLQSFKTHSHKRVMCSTKALTTGYDVPTLDTAIVLGFTSKVLPSIQKIGRIVRYQEGKLAKIVILYVKNSQEEKWLNKALQNQSVVWLKIEQLKDTLNQDLQESLDKDLMKKEPI